MRESEQKRPRSAASATSSAPSTRRSRWPSRSRRGSGAATRCASSPCSSSPRRARCSSASPWRSSRRSRWRPSAASSCAIRRCSSRSTAAAQSSSTRPARSPTAGRRSPRSSLPGVRRGTSAAAAASVERYSRHPLAAPVLEAARAATSPARGLCDQRAPGRRARSTSAPHRVEHHRPAARREPGRPACRAAGCGGRPRMHGPRRRRVRRAFRFRDAPRDDSRLFIDHLGERHGYEDSSGVGRPRLGGAVPGRHVGITEVHADQSPRGQGGHHARRDRPGSHAVHRRRHQRRAGAGHGHGRPRVRARATSPTRPPRVVILDSVARARGRVLPHQPAHAPHRAAERRRRHGVVARRHGVRRRRPALAVAGAVTQEIIDVAAVLNALRAAWPPRALTDF
jgi:hypothetical protein